MESAIRHFWKHIILQKLPDIYREIAWQNANYNITYESLVCFSSIRLGMCNVYLGVFGSQHVNMTHPVAPTTVSNLIPTINTKPLLYSVFIMRDFIFH